MTEEHHDDKARATKACLGIPALEHHVPSLFMAPLTRTQREAMITMWIVPCALALTSAKRAHRVQLIVHITMHLCHGAIAVCHTMGSFIKWNGFAIIGVALAASASALVGLQHLLTDAKQLKAAGDDLMHVGTKLLSTMTKEVSEDQWAAFVDDLLAAAKTGAARTSGARAPQRSAPSAKEEGSSTVSTTATPQTKVNLNA